MWGFSIKRFLITLGLSVGVWLLTVVIQGITLYKVTFSLLGSSCQLTGFPIAKCVSGSSGEVPFWVIHIINILFWFWVIHLLWGGVNWFNKSKN